MNFFQKLFSTQEPKSDILTRIRSISDQDIASLPAYLVYPTDGFSKTRFEPSMLDVRNKRCGYQFRLYKEIANPVPEIKQGTPPFEINETHIFWKEKADAWYSVSTMKGENVTTSNLRGWVESQDQLGCMFNNMIPFLNLPSSRQNCRYKRVAMYDMGESKKYNQLHGFEETHLFCHIFYLDNRLFKKFILCAKQMSISWKVECTIPSTAEQITATDFVPPGQAFGSFFPYP